MLKIVGFGSGAKDNMTLEASAAISSAQLIVGYNLSLIHISEPTRRS